MIPIDFTELSTFLTEAGIHYEKTAPTVKKYLDGLYMRSQEGRNVYLEEIIQVQALKENGTWEQPDKAANRIYKLQNYFGREYNF